MAFDAGANGDVDAFAKQFLAIAVYILKEAVRFRFHFYHKPWIIKKCITAWYKRTPDVAGIGRCRAGKVGSFEVLFVYIAMTALTGGIGCKSVKSCFCFGMIACHTPAKKCNCRN